MMDPADNSFGVLRLMLALTVLVSHSLWFATGRRESDPMIAVTGFTTGEHAVQVFFLLSGLLVAHALEKSGDVRDFAVARTLRIFPGLIVCVALTALVLGPMTTTLSTSAYFVHPDLPAYVAKTASLVTASARLPGVFEGNPLAGLVNGSLWTLKFEAVCYAGLGPLAYLGLIKSRPAARAEPAPLRAQLELRSPRTIAVCALLAIIGISSAALPLDTTRYSTLENLAYFAIPFSLGVLACLFRDRIPASPLTPILLATVAWLAVASPLQHIATGLFLGSLALWLATFQFGPLRAFANRRDLSYGVYIYAAPIQQALIAIYPGVDAAAVTALAVLPVLVLAWLSWTFVEKPAMGMRRGVVAVLDGRTKRKPA